MTLSQTAVFVEDRDGKIDEAPFVIYDFDPRNLPPEYLRAIGLVIAASAQTERVLQHFIGALLGIDNVQALALTTQMSFPLKDDVIRALVELDAPTLKMLDEVDDLLDAVKDAINKRNAIAHNALMTHPDTGQVFSKRLKARGSLQLELKAISVAEIEQDADLIYKVGINIVNFMRRTGLSLQDRTKPLREPVNRGKRARLERRDGNL